jgi:HSP20 family protein
MVSRTESLPGFYPVRDLMQQLLADSFVRAPGTWSAASSASAFPYDLYEAGDDFLVRVALPGAQEQDLELAVNQGVLTLKGYRAFYTGEQEKQYRWHVRGLPEGTFQFSVMLPTAVDADHADATFDRGVLTIRLPKAEIAKTKRIAVTSTPQRTLTAQPS